MREACVWPGSHSPEVFGDVVLLDQLSQEPVLRRRQGRDGRHVDGAQPSGAVQADLVLAAPGL